MNCSYCEKPQTFVFVLQENVPGVGPQIRHACFPCIQTIGDKIMVEIRKVENPEPLRPPDVTPLDMLACVPCSSCGGMRRENCKAYGKHQHDWCDCQ